MKLKPRTTYRDGQGKQVCIVGPAQRELDGKTCWWSIQGDHYTEDGLFVHTRRVPCNGSHATGLQLESLTHATSLRNLVSEDKSGQARKWWEGVEA